MQTLPVLDAWFSKCQRNKNERPGLQNVYFKCTWNHPNKLIAHLHHQVWWPPLWVFPDSSAGKESACNAGNLSSIPGSGRSTGEGIGYPLQYSWASLVAQLVKNLPAIWETWVGKIHWGRDWLCTPVFWPGEFQRLYSPWGHKESDMTEWLSLFTFFTTSTTWEALYINNV